MILIDVIDQIDMLYSTRDLHDSIQIATGYRIDGAPINFHFYQEDEKYAYITTNAHFTDWLSCYPDGLSNAAPLIEQLASLYDVHWDCDHGRLVIRFRRNEITLAQAVMRLLQAVFLVGNI
jgi:hypothetical protein